MLCVLDRLDKVRLGLNEDRVNSAELVDQTDLGSPSESGSPDGDLSPRWIADSLGSKRIP
jgi:hypothetical protein